SLEVIESIETLKGNGPEDLTKVSMMLATNMLYVAGKGDIEYCEELVKKSIKDGSALKKLVEMVEAQGGDISQIQDTDKFKKATYSYEVIAARSGYVSHMDTEKCGIASMLLGAGRETKDSVLDYSAGISLKKKTADKVQEGEILAV